MSFVMEMASEIQDIQIAVMEFDQLFELLPAKMEIHYKDCLLYTSPSPRD